VIGVGALPQGRNATFPTIHPKKLVDFVCDECHTHGQFRFR